MVFSLRGIVGKSDLQSKQEFTNLLVLYESFDARLNASSLIVAFG